MALFNWVRPDERRTSEVLMDAAGDRFDPRAILRALEEAVPRYISDVDQGKLIYPACKRTLSDKEVTCVPSGIKPGSKRYAT